MPRTKTVKETAVGGVEGAPVLSRVELMKQKANEAKKKMLEAPPVVVEAQAAVVPEEAATDENAVENEAAETTEPVSTKPTTRKQLQDALKAALAKKRAAARIGPNGKKKRRSRPGMKALREIRDEQKSTKLLIKRAPFFRLMLEICQDLGVKDYRFNDIRFKKTAKDDLQEVVEDMMIWRFEMMQEIAINAGHKTIMERDAKFCNKILNRTNNRNGLTCKSYDEELTVPIKMFEERKRKRRTPKKTIDGAPKKAITKKPKAPKAAKVVEVTDLESAAAAAVADDAEVVERPAKVAKRTKKQITRDALAEQKKIDDAAAAASVAPATGGGDDDDDMTQLTGDEDGADRTAAAPIDTEQTLAMENPEDML